MARLAEKVSGDAHEGSNTSTEKHCLLSSSLVSQFLTPGSVRVSGSLKA